LVVDGHSKDGTDLKATNKGVKVIYQRKQGYGDALRTGFMYARRYMNPRALVMMDADSTYDPKDIPSLVQPILSDEADMVIGNRFSGLEPGSMTRTNKMGNRILSTVARITLGLRIQDSHSGIRALRTDLLDDINFDAKGMPFATEMIVDASGADARISEVPVHYRPRLGEAKLKPINDGVRIFGTIIRLVRDTKPLLFFGLAGLILGIFGVYFGIIVTVEWVQTSTVQRLPTVMLAVLLLVGSMQFFILALVADMIKRFNSQRNRRG
jgi:glycosyltransferase involved in cell wall biosynthesis